MKRILLAGLVGGVLTFGWGAVAHMATPLGETGIKTLPNEKAVLDSFRDGKLEHGIYFFPAAGMPENHSDDEAMKKWTQEHKHDPMGLVVHHPARGEELLPVSTLLKELASNLLSALLAACVLANTKPSVFLRVVFSTLIGVIGWLSISGSYWIWYRYSTDYTLAEGVMQAVGWFIAGIGMALCLRKKE